MSDDTNLTSATTLTGAICTSAKMYSTKEAAKFLHMSLRNFQYLTNAKQIRPMQTGARNTKFYSENQLLTYAKLSSPMQSDPCKNEKLHQSTSAKNPPMQNKGATMTNLNNLPDEFKNSARFFAVGTDKNPKAPKVKNWSNPENQTTLDNIEGAAGFDTCGHGNGVDYLFLDFDHVLNPNGEFVNDTAAATVLDLQAQFPSIYIEKSISGTGLHAFLKPNPDKFDALNAGSKGTIYFSDSREKDAPKLEMFYGSGGRYCYVTGDLFNTGAEIPSGEPADDFLYKLLAEIRLQLDSRKALAVESSLEKRLNSDHAGISDFPILSARKKEVNQERIDSIMGSDTTVTTATTISKDDLFSTEEVAKVVGVTVRTLQYWNKKRIFEPYLIDHKGNFFYTREELEQLQSVYHKDWHRPHKRQKQARTSCGHSESDFADISSGQNVKDNPPEYIHDLAIELWYFGNFADAERADWLPCISALKNLGFSKAEVKAMCETSPRYDENAFDAEFESLKDISNFGIETLIGKCPTFDFKEFARKWYSNHPQFKSKFTRSNNDRIQSLIDELQEVEKQLAEFDAEKEKAIESLTNFETFDSETVFLDNVLTAAAFAKIYNRQVFSEFKKAIQKFKKAHPDKGVGLPDFTAAVKDAEKVINSRRAELETQRTKIKAKIQTLNFTSDDDFLKGLTFPDDYVVDDNGIGKVVGKNIKTICRRPVLVAKKIFAADEEVTKLILAFKNGIGVWKNSHPTDRAEVFNAKDLVKLANSDFPFTSQNVGGAVEYLDAFLALNEKNLSTAYSFKNFGWHEFKGQKFFLDSRRDITVEVDGTPFPVCCTSKSQFARALKSVGSLEKWRQIYNKVKKYPVARFTVAAAIAAPLLEILGERGFWIHTHTKTRSGKSTALKFATSAVGNPDGVIKNFNATINGLQGVAAEYNGFSFPIDEWQAASEKLKSQVSNLIHNLIDGTARTKMNKDSTVRENENWLTIVMTNGETVMLNDNSLGGEFTRVLNIAAPSPILPPELCKEIHDTIKDNHGLIFPLIIDELQRRKKDELREIYFEMVKKFFEIYSKPDNAGNEKLQAILPEHCRYIAVISIADFILNVALGENEELSYRTAIDNNAKEIFKLIPTIEEIDDASRAKEMILGFVAKYSAHFEGMEGYEQKYGRDTYGKKGDVADQYFYITIDAVKIACKENDFDYKHLVKNLTDDSFFVPSDKIENGYKKPRPSVVSKINGVSTRCYRVNKREVVDDYD